MYKVVITIILNVRSSLSSMLYQRVSSYLLRLNERRPLGGCLSRHLCMAMLYRHGWRHHYFTISSPPMSGGNHPNFMSAIIHHEKVRLSIHTLGKMQAKTLISSDWGVAWCFQSSWSEALPKKRAKLSWA